MTPLEREIKAILDTLDAFEEWRKALPAPKAQEVRDTYVKARETMPVPEACAYVKSLYQ